MRYDGNIREKLKLVRLYNDKIEYELSYLLSQNCRTFTALKTIDIINYVNEYYFRKKQIDYDNLINDINVFKSYRDNLDINIRKESDLGQFITICLAWASIIINVQLDDRDVIKLILILSLLVLVSLGYYSFNIGIHSESYKLKVINNAIYTLETIKEDMDNNGNSGTESDEIISSVNDKLDDGNTEDADEVYEGLKLTELKEIRTYKARKNKYSPRAMYERKRR